MGSFGCLFLDVSCWMLWKLMMMEEDFVICCCICVLLCLFYVFEGVDKGDLDIYWCEYESQQGEIIIDFFSNRKGLVMGIQGDVNLDQICDVIYLFDIFFVGMLFLKGLMGYIDGMVCDIFEDFKCDYYEEVDGMQEIFVYVYV